MFGRSVAARVDKLEDHFTAMDERLGGVESAVGGLGGKIDKLVEGMTDTGERAAQRAQAVKGELRDEADRKGRERNDLLKNGLSLVGFVALIVGAFCGPYLNKINATGEGQAADTVAIAAVREVLAQQGAGIGRNQASLDIQRENSRIRDAEIREHDQDIAFMKGAMSAKGWPVR